MNSEIKQVDLEMLEIYLQNRPWHVPGKIEDVELKIIEHKPGVELPVVSMRNAIFMGMQPTKLRIEEGYRESQLCYEGGTWMTDQPQEVWQMDDVIQNAYGNVAVGGLGLGVVSHLIALLSDAESVTTIENDQRIIDLVDRDDNPLAHDECIYCDLYQWLADLQPGEVDFAFFDIWQPTGQRIWHQEVVPLRRLARGKITDVLCWNEEEMIGQYRMNINRYAYLDEKLFGTYDTTALVFHRAAVKQKLVKKKDMITSRKPTAELMELEGKHSPKLDALAERLFQPGTDEWEKEFGKLWDQAVEDREKENQDD